MKTLLSESGYPRFKDVQDGDFVVFFRLKKSSAFIRVHLRSIICLNQDVQDLRIYRMLVCVGDFLDVEIFWIFYDLQFWW